MPHGSKVKRNSSTPTEKHSPNSWLKRLEAAVRSVNLTSTSNEGINPSTRIQTLGSKSPTVSSKALISQNRQAEKDRVKSNIEYEVNIKAELEVAHLHEKTDRIYENMMKELAGIRQELRKAPLF